MSEWVSACDSRESDDDCARREESPIMISQRQNNLSYRISYRHSRIGHETVSFSLCQPYSRSVVRRLVPLCLLLVAPTALNIERSTGKYR